MLRTPEGYFLARERAQGRVKKWQAAGSQVVEGNEILQQFHGGEREGLMQADLPVYGLAPCSFHPGRYRGRLSSIFRRRK